MLRFQSDAFINYGVYVCGAMMSNGKKIKRRNEKEEEEVENCISFKKSPHKFSDQASLIRVAPKHIHKRGEKDFKLRIFAAGIVSERFYFFL